jgi:precorrin-6A synthase
VVAVAANIGEKIYVMRHLKIIGIGAGDPGYMTIQAIEQLNHVDVFFVVDKGEDKSDLLHMRHQICARHIEHNDYRTVEIPDPPRDLSGLDYDEAVRAWHGQRVSRWEAVMAAELGPGQVGAFLAWGDPALYDSTLLILGEIRARGLFAFDLELIPGISAVQALAARHQISLTQVGRSVVVTSGRQLEEQWRGGVNDVVVMLDAHCTFLKLDDLDATIYWGAYLGTEDEILIAGTIAERGEEIRQARDRARSRKGWVFDTYLLRARP